MKRLIVFLLLLNFITTLAVGYTIYTDNSKKKPYIIEIESPTEGDDEQFKEDIYKGMSRLMMGQNYLNLRLLSLHHFVKPHVDEFYEHCPECQLEKKKILKEEIGNMTFTLGAK